MLLPVLTFLSVTCVLTGFPRHLRREPPNVQNVLEEIPRNIVPILQKVPPQYWQTLSQQGYPLPYRSEDITGHGFMPSYIKRALGAKNKVVPKIPEKKHTVYNLTLQDVFNRISDITKALNYKAYENGYKVDYKFRILDRLK